MREGDAGVMEAPEESQRRVSVGHVKEWRLGPLSVVGGSYKTEARGPQ